VALFTMACWLVSVVFNEIMAERLRPDSVSAYGGATFVAEGSPAWQERQVIIERNLFGAKVAHQQAIRPPEPEIDVEETKLPLQLLGTLWSSDSQLSTAAIRDVQKRLVQVVAVGESLDERSEVKVASIERGRVILLNGSRREELLLSEEGDAPGRASAASAAVASPKSRSAGRTGVDGPRPSATRRASRSASDVAATKYAIKARRLASKNAESGAKARNRSRVRKSTSKASREQQQEAERIMKSLIDSGAGPGEIDRQMMELERRHLAGD
jgi:type II secretory pathway component PulC